MSEFHHHSPSTNLDKVTVQPCRIRIRTDRLEPLDNIRLLILILLLSPPGSWYTPGTHARGRSSLLQASSGSARLLSASSLPFPLSHLSIISLPLPLTLLLAGRCRLCERQISGGTSGRRGRRAGRTPVARCVGACELVRRFGRLSRWETLGSRPVKSGTEWGGRKRGNTMCGRRRGAFARRCRSRALF